MSKSDANAIYIRTEKGQALAMAHHALHEEQSHVLLRLVNGYTPCGHLARIAATSIPDAEARFSSLEDLGLIRKVQGPGYPKLHAMHLDGAWQKWLHDRPIN